MSNTRAGLSASDLRLIAETPAVAVNRFFYSAIGDGLKLTFCETTDVAGDPATVPRAAVHLSREDVGELLAMLIALAKERRLIAMTEQPDAGDAAPALLATADPE